MTLAILIPLALKLSIMLVAFAFGLTTTHRAATLLFRQPSQLLRLGVAMNLAMPALTLAAVLAFQLRPAVEVALVALAASPVPPLLPNKAIKAGGQSDYIAGVMVAASVLACFSLPLFMRLIELVAERPIEVPLVSVFGVLMTSVLLPLGAGVLINHYRPAFALRAAKVTATVGGTALALALLPILVVAGKPMLGLLGDGTLLAFAAFAASALLLGHLLGGPSPEHRSVLALATASRHPAIALGLAQPNFDEPKLVVPAILLYLLVSAFVSVPYLLWTKRRRARNNPPQAENT